MLRTGLSVLLALGALTALLLASGAALAWGSSGHRIVARIGEDNLTATTHARIRELTGSASLALLATWPDFIRSDPDWDCAQPWHYLTVEDNETVATGMAHVAVRPESCVTEFNRLKLPNNVVSAIDYFADIVAGDHERTASFAEFMSAQDVEPYRGSVPLTALIFLVHLVGDVHQPLHVGRGDDRGGNSIKTQWFGELTSLHSLWDEGLIAKEGLSFSEFAAFLEQEFSGQESVDYGAGPETWAMESFLSRHEVYDTFDPKDPGANLPKLSYDYAAEKDALLKQRLYRGGKRLATLLNRIFDGNPEATSQD